MSFNAIEYFQGLGKPVLVDLDDAYQSLPWSNPAHRFWVERDGGEALKKLEEGLRLADGLVAPNRLLLRSWSHVTRASYYLQNYSEREWWVDLPTREELKIERGLEDRIIIGWGGSVSHYDSWWGSGIMEAARRVSARHPEVVWLVCGNDPRIHAMLPVWEGQKIIQRGVPPDQWPRTVRCCDVGVAPLFGPYDQHRSWIKGLEYLHAGVPWVATGGEPYRDFREIGLGLYVNNGPDEWEAALEDVLADLPDRQEEAAALVEMSRRWHVQNQLHVHHQVYSKAISNFSDDHGRLPGVFKVAPANGAGEGGDGE